MGERAGEIWGVHTQNTGAGSEPTLRTVITAVDVAGNRTAIECYFADNGGIKPVSEETMSHYTNATSMTSTAMFGYHPSKEFGASTRQGVSVFLAKQETNNN